MIPLPPGVRVWLATGDTDMRKGFPSSVKGGFGRRDALLGVRRAKAALSSGCKSHPAIAPAGSNRSSHGGNEVAEAFD
jgi:hypothetical protein